MPAFQLCRCRPGRTMADVQSRFSSSVGVAQTLF
jgi:hypothetical protein